MRLMHSLLAATALIGLSITAHATPVTFDFNATGTGVGRGSAQTATYSGTITIDTSNNQVTATSITAVVSNLGTFYFKDGTFSSSPAADDSSFSFFGETHATAAASAFSYGNAILKVNFSDPASGIYTGGAIDADSSSFKYSSYNLDVSGTIGSAALPTAATPEPSSLILLGTGILTLAGATRRRFLKA